MLEYKNVGDPLETFYPSICLSICLSVCWFLCLSVFSVSESSCLCFFLCIQRTWWHSCSHLSTFRTPNIRHCSYFAHPSNLSLANWPIALWFRSSAVVIYQAMKYMWLNKIYLSQMKSTWFHRKFTSLSVYFWCRSCVVPAELQNIPTSNNILFSLISTDFAHLSISV